MPKDYSPFTPGQPVVLEFFVGRAEQARAMLRHVKASAGGRVEIIFVSGERGIGKTSLASFVRVAAERQEQMLGIHTFLGGVTDLEEMARRVFDRLLKESEDKPWHQRIVDLFGNRIQRVGLFGITLEFRPRQDELRQIVHDFVPVLRNLARWLREEKHGFLLILDDINGLASTADFANWLKSIVDEIATSREVVPLCLVLVGLEERRIEMIQHQPSLARVFRLVDVPLWSDEESAEFFRKAFQSVNLPVETKTLEHIVNLSGGHPALAHEIGDAVFYADSDGYVDEHDAFEGVLRAADIVGHKYLEPQVYRALRSPRYRTILRTLAQGNHPFFKRAQIREQLNQQERKVFDNFLQRMRKLEVIIPDEEGGPGAYKFRNALHLLYFALEAERQGHHGH
jgi:hypothetical protein